MAPDVPGKQQNPITLVSAGGGPYAGREYARVRARIRLMNPGTGRAEWMLSVKLGLANQLGRFNRNYATVDPDLWCYRPFTW